MRKRSGVHVFVYVFLVGMHNYNINLFVNLLIKKIVELCYNMDERGGRVSTFDQVISNSGAFANVTLCIVTLISVTIAYVSFKDSKKRRKREKAIELANYYSNTILKPSAFISEAITNSEFEIISRNCFHIEAIKDFDVNEINTLLKKYDQRLSIDKLNNLINNISPRKIAGAALFRDEFTEFNTRYQIYFNNIKMDDKESVKKLFDLSFKNQLNQAIVDLLNNIEWFAMNFNSGIADEETVYQSLHQTYLGIVSQLYFFIARKNEFAYAKYYTNTIALFGEWMNKENEIKEKEERYENKSVQKKNRLFKRQRRI